MVWNRIPMQHGETADGNTSKSACVAPSARRWWWVIIHLLSVAGPQPRRHRPYPYDDPGQREKASKNHDHEKAFY